ANAASMEAGMVGIGEGSGTTGRSSEDDATRGRQLWETPRASRDEVPDMALKSTIHRVELAIADIERGYYQDHTLTLARHPSETEERLMVRLLAFAMHAHPALGFGAGLSDVEEPDLWLRDDTGAIELWIEVGLPDERRLRRACGRARQVVAISYGRNAALWWRQQQHALARLDRLTVVELPVQPTLALAALARRTMRVQANASEGLWWIGSEDGSVSVEPSLLKQAG